MKKRLVSIVLCIILVLAHTAALASPFADVDPVKYSWADSQITEMADLGIINGYDARTFGPEDAVRKVDALLLVSRIAGSVAEGEEGYLQMAYDEYSQTVSSLGYSNYEETLSYLIYRGIYTEDELISFLRAKAGDAPLKRYEAAVILVKLLGAEEQVKMNKMPTLSFSDANEIPANAKAYVEYCYENKLMVGMTETEFSPNTSVTRAQMAVLLKKAMDKLNLTYSRGTVLDVNEVTDTIKYSDLNSNTKTLNITLGEIPFKLNGSNLEGLDKLKAGDKITAIYSDSSLIFVEAATVIPDQVVTGIFSGKTSTISTNKITIRPDLTSSDIEEYTLTPDCTILLDNEIIGLDSLKSTYHLTLKIENNRVTSIIAEEKDKTVTGVISSFVYEAPSRLKIVFSNNTTEEYEFAGAVTVKRNGKPSSVDELMVGDKVTLNLVYNKISNVVATSTVKTVEGNIEEIVISKNPRITVNTGSQSVECYIDASSIEITINGEENANVYDLKLGDKATLTVESSTVTKIDVETAAISVDTINIVGTVENVDTNYMCITLTVSDGSTQQVFVKKNASILDSATQKSRTLSSIKAGDTITAVITSNGFTQEAISIVILTK